MTDGVVEQPGPTGEQFGYERLEEALRSRVTPEELVQTVREWSETSSFDDDMTVVSITYDGP